MRFFVGGLEHESNSFSPIATGQGNFAEDCLFRPEHAGSEPLPAGYGYFVDLVRSAGDEVVPGPFARAEPSAPASQEAYCALRDDLLAALAAAGPCDGVLLWLHGAQMAQGIDDCEGDLLRRVRGIVGDDTPIGAVLDLHATVTREMLDCADILIACKEYPHTDFAARAAECFDLVRKTAEGRLSTRMTFLPIPMLSNFHTTREPMRSLVDDMIAMEGRNGILSISLIHGFCWADTPDSGAGVLVISERSSMAAEETAVRLADRFFAVRNAYHGALCDAPAAMAAIRAAARGPVVIADLADNPGGGMAGDSTFLLRQVLGQDLGPLTFATIWDPVACANAVRAGVGATLPLRIGGKLGPFSGDPVDLTVTVTGIAADDARFRTPFSDRPEPLGSAAAVRAGDISIILNAKRTQIYGPDVLQAVGIDPTRQRAIIVKSAQHFHAMFAPIAERILYCDTPGGMTGDIARLPYAHVRRPIWPLDPLTERPPTAPYSPKG